MMIEVVFLILAVVVGTPQGPDAAVRTFAIADLASCEAAVKKVEAAQEKGTAARAKCVTLTFPAELFKKGIEINAASPAT